MSSALKRRFNFETVLPVAELQEEIRIVRDQVTSLLAGSPAEKTQLSDDTLELLVTTFHELREAAAARHPLERIGTADDQAALARFLLADESGWISGQILHADGGMSSIRKFS